MQHRRHKTKLLIPAGAGTNQPADVGDQPGRLGEGRNRIPRAAITSAGIDNIINAKKTTHALHRRFAFISGISTADVIRIPNWAGFCIRGEFEHTQHIIKQAPFSPYSKNDYAHYLFPTDQQMRFICITFVLHKYVRIRARGRGNDNRVSNPEFQYGRTTATR